MPKKSLTISLVIPVYNEESHLAACLRLALAQTLPFHEIIVVDNNSSDATATVAAGFPGVKVLREPRQGVVYARNRGFNAARGDIIARIDADTHLPTDWTTKISRIFDDEVVGAVSGAISYHDIAARQIIDPIDFKLRNWLAGKMPQRMFLLGANMAIRRSAWRTVAGSLCAGGLHEDLDLAVHLSDVGATVLFAPELVAGVSGRRVDTNVLDFIKYLRSLPQTYAVHGAREHIYMYPVAGVVLLHYLPLRVLFRGYDEQLQSFRLTKLFTLQAPARVNPATFVE
jgi:cellulose synthase/poly-beta-1,6-N-acetylglucosamine synthase-like glycosyltransferase